MDNTNVSEPPRKLNRGVVFGEDVLDYLAQLGGATGCSRSYLVNRIIRIHALGNGAAGQVADVEGIVAPVIRM